VTFRYEPIGDYPDGEYNIGRQYYWSDPAGLQPWIRDREFRLLHPEIAADDWQQLFAEAFDRGERTFLEALQQSEPGLFESEPGQRIAFLGYTFGPCWPSRETLQALGLENQNQTGRAPRPDPALGDLCANEEREPAHE
jgi:hypothetical protein